MKLGWRNVENSEIICKSGQLPPPHRKQEKCCVNKAIDPSSDTVLISVDKIWRTRILNTNISDAVWFAFDQIQYIHFFLNPHYVEH